MGKILDLTESDRGYFAEFWERYRHKTVSRYLPLPNKITTVVESDQRDRYVNKEQTDLDKIYFTLADTYPEFDIRVDENEDLMGKNLKALVDALAEVQKNILFGKKGMIRYHAGAGKLPLLVVLLLPVNLGYVVLIRLSYRGCTGSLVWINI